MTRENIKIKADAIFIDIDGTLVNSEKKITPGVYEALTEAMKRGIKVCIASGRPLKGTVSCADKLFKDYDGYVLAYNGGLIVDWKTKEILRDANLSFDIIKEAYSLAKENDADIITYKGDTILSENLNNPYMQIEARINNLDVMKVDNILESINQMPAKCLILGDDEKIAKLEQKANELFREKATVFRSEPYFLEIMPYGVDKASSIEFFIDKFGIDLANTVAFGDGFNDISMIKYAGVGVAMKNGCDEIKETADYITDYSNDENGIAEFMKKYIL